MTKGKKHPILVLVRGLPGSGKSYIADRVLQLFPKGEVILLDPDRTDYESSDYKDLSRKLRQEGVDEKFYPYRFLRAQAHAAIESCRVVMWTQAFTQLDGFQKTIVNLTDYAKRHGLELPLIVVEVEVAPDLAKARISERVLSGGLDVDSDRFDRFVSEYGSFESEGYDTLRIDGSSDPDEAAKRIYQKVLSVLA